jgi:hypothetical protein
LALLLLILLLLLLLHVLLVSSHVVLILEIHQELGCLDVFRVRRGHALLLHLLQFIEDFLRLLLDRARHWHARVLDRRRALDGRHDFGSSMG